MDTDDLLLAKEVFRRFQFRQLSNIVVITFYPSKTSFSDKCRMLKRLGHSVLGKVNTVGDHHWSVRGQTAQGLKS